MTLPPLLLTLAEAGELLNMSKRSVERLAKAGKIPTIQDHLGQRRIARSTIDDYITAQLAATK